MLVICLLVVLCVVIALSYYENIEYFTAIAPQPGNTVKCTIDVTGGKGTGTYYQYAAGNTLNPYPDLSTALSWDLNAATPIIIADCSDPTKYKVGAPVAMNPTPVTAVGKPNDLNRSYGSLNVPEAQRGAPSTSRSAPSTSGSTALAPAPSTSSSSAPAPSDPQSQLAAATPLRQDVTPQVSLSDAGYTALELQNKSNLLKNIQKIVRNEIVASRNQPENNPMAMGNESCDSSDSNAMQQGNEYKRNKPDMSQYIKKDSIPCWGCSLDY
jgi:hypothetical protein